MGMTGRIDVMSNDWKVKREISLPLVLGLIVHTGTFIWFIATLNNRVDQFEKQASAFVPQVEKIIKLGADMENVKDGIAEIKGLLRNTVLPGKRTESIVR